MDGDDPLDFEANVRHVCKMQDDDFPVTKTVLEKYMKSLLQYVRDLKDTTLKADTANGLLTKVNELGVDLPNSVKTELQSYFAGDENGYFDDDMLKICGCFNPNKYQQIPAKTLEKHFSELWGMCKNEYDVQALGFLMMQSGAKMPDEFKEELLHDVENDEWAKESPKRKKEMDKFAALIRGYHPGHQIKLKKKGLFDNV